MIEMILLEAVLHNLLDSDTDNEHFYEFKSLIDKYGKPVLYETCQYNVGIITSITIDGMTYVYDWLYDFHKKEETI